MDAHAERVAVADRPRADQDTAFELFVRDDADAPLRHAGSVAAADATAAYEYATRLFPHDPEDVWVCPAGEVSRYTTHDLDAEATPAPDANAPAPDANVADSTEPTSEGADRTLDGGDAGSEGQR